MDGDILKDSEQFKKSIYFLNTLSERHELLFPLATLNGQTIKFEEEVNEFLSSKNDKDSTAKEIADVIITCIGIGRFNACVAKNALLGFLSSNEIEMDVLDKALEIVPLKWEKNESRTWVYNQCTGEYHHKGEDEYD